LQEILFSCCPANASLIKVFRKLFVTLNNELGNEYLQESSSCLVKCLEKDETCHYEWRNNYLERMKESRLVYYQEHRSLMFRDNALRQRHVHFTRIKWLQPLSLFQF
jgi:hypothetical protein